MNMLKVFEMYRDKNYNYPKWWWGVGGGRGESRFGQTKDYEIDALCNPNDGIWCISAKH